MPFYKIDIRYCNTPICNEKLLISAKSEEEAIIKTGNYFDSVGVNADVISVRKSTICCFLGDTDAPMLYVGKVIFIGSNMEHQKQRSIAIGANTLMEAIDKINDIFEDISNIKHHLLSELQLKEIEYWEEMKYIDYEIIGITRTDMEYIA